MKVTNNNKMLRKITLIFLIGIFFFGINFISAEKVTIEQTNGILISDANQEVIEKGVNHTFDFHLSKLDDGTLINDNDTICSMALYNNNGELLLNKNLSYDTGTASNWDIEISGDHLERLGTYTYLVQCADSLNKIGGVRSLEFTVTPTGILQKDLNQTGVFILFFLIGCSFLFISTQTNQPGIKIFFIFSAFVFIMGGLTSSYIVINESSITETLAKVIISMIYAFGLIFFVAFAYVLINQIKESMNLMRENKGYEMDF